MKISAVLITFNEEKNIGLAVDSVKWADECVVVDGGSSDKTIQIAKEKGAKVLSNPFQDFSTQKNYALKQAVCEWAFFLDADERCQEILRDEILKCVSNNQDVNGYFVKRRNFFLGKELRFGNHARDYQMRLFKREQAKFKNCVHEIVEIKGKTGYLRNGAILHHTKLTVSDYFVRFGQYTDLEARFLVESGRYVTRQDCIWKPLVRFFYFYVLKGGFLDRFHGFVYHMLSFFYYFVKLLKTRELQKKI